MGSLRRRLAFAVRVPVRIGEEAGYVLSYVPPEGLMQRVVDETYRPEGWFGLVLDANGSVIARSHRHEEFVGREIPQEDLDRIKGEAGIFERTDLEGRPSLTAYHASDASGWTVFVWAPRALLEGPAAKARRWLLALAALAVGVSLGSAHVAGRLIRQPAAQVIRAAQDLGRGERVVFPPSLMREANIAGAALEEASETIRLREAALRENEAHMQLVLRELSHRTKNLLTVIQSIAGKSARMSPNFEAFRTSFQNRLMGLSRSHDLLVERKWEGVPLDELVASQLSAFTHPEEGRVMLAGPALPLSPQAAQSLGMALHELATNALKYGALSVRGGRVLMAWERAADAKGEPRIRLRWKESGGPPVSPPARRGFGSLVIEDVVAQSLHGATRLDWDPEGLIWELDAPAAFMT
jgi:two-component sensor histidine kinase